MTRFSKFLACCALPLCSTLTGYALADQPAVPAVKASWTLRYYLDADSDLEPPMMTNLEDRLKVDSSDAVNI